jgi:hypothetical protein
MTTLQPSQQIDLFQMASPSTLSLAVTHASHSATQESSSGNQTPDTFGPTCSGLFESPDPSGYLPKTLRDTFNSECPTYAGSWKQKAIESGHSLYRLAPQVRDTYATEFSLSDKDTLQQIKQRMDGSAAPVIEEFLKDASVTTVKDYAAIVGSGHTRSTTRWLTAALTAERTGMFPTPTANEDATGRPGSKMQIMLGNHPSVRDTTKKVLSPEWTELLMGFPAGWTDLER